MYLFHDALVSFAERREIKMKKYKTVSIIYYLSAALFYVSAIISFIGGNENSIGTTGLCLGSAFLCFGSVYLNKSKENKDNNEGKDE